MSTDFLFSVADDELLIKESVKGNKEALKNLIIRYKDWIFNIAICMTGNAFEAEDVTQEIIIKIITRLSSFMFKSSFRTWIYRITVNYFYSMKKRDKERFFDSFERHRTFFEELPDDKITGIAAIERKQLIEETKTECLLAMLLCLDREQRMVFILGGIFGINSEEASDFLEISEDNFRQKLSRARKELKNYMENNCGLVNKGNPCRCSKKARAALAAGYINPANLQFAEQHVKKVRDFLDTKKFLAKDFYDWRHEKYFRDRPYKIFQEGKILELIEGVR